MSTLAGAVVWAIVPFVPAAPFELYAGTERTPISVPDADTILRAARRDGGDAQFTYLVAGKARPVLVLSDAHDQDLGEYLALRLARFSKLTADQQQAVRDGKHPTLCYLDADRISLPEANAVMIAGLVRLHRTAISTNPVGRLHEHELRTIQERFIRFHKFDMRAVLTAAAQQATQPRRR